MTILDMAIKYKPEIDDNLKQKLKKLDLWDFSKLVDDMNPRLLLEEGRLFSIEQLIPLLLHFAQSDPEIKKIAKDAIEPWLSDKPYSQRRSSLDENAIESACQKINVVVKQIEAEFKRFVAISLIEPNAIHAPSGPVDMFWHFLILHTVEYELFCKEVWGSHKFDKHIAA